MRYFQVSVERLCGEFVCGRVSRAFWEYWKDQDPNDLAQHLYNLDDADIRDGNSPPIRPNGEEADGYYDVDDIGHVNNAVLWGNTIQVDEVEPDEESYSGFRSRVDGYTEAFDISEIFSDMPDAFATQISEIAVDTEIEDPSDPVFVAKSIEKGAQTIVYCEDEAGFNIKKLAFSFISFDGDSVIRDVFYDGTLLENHPDSSMGRDFICYVGDLVDYEPIDEDAAFETLSKAASKAPKSPKLVWVIWLIALTILASVLTLFFIIR